MEKKVSREVQEVLNNTEEFDVEKYKEEVMSFNIKTDINQLLFQHLPDDITIKEAEALAVVIHKMIVNPYEFLNAK